MSETVHKPSIFVIIPPPIWALLFFLIGWGAGAALKLDRVFQSTAAGVALVIAGFAFAAWGRLTFARVGAEIQPASAKNSVLVTNGPFHFTRNPMYLGILIIMIGLSLVVGTVAALISIIVYVLWANFISIPYEEQKMERQFGEDYRAYKKSVRRWI
ncbi:MAG TPA: isoprenylcysteine carboxylmethyltransferase family protein [Parvularculaceae bacterium]|nr:isoprenylcysteine carboxylmethyltransferase family protein [Parvularculaceae bacterium]